jgi:hypothetical protein
MDKATARLMGAFFIAVTTAMPKQAAKLASDVLLDVADNPRTRDEDGEILRAIAQSVCLDDDYVAERPRFEVIEGGNSAA